MWQMIGVLAELERSLISERTPAGVKAARSRGVKFGRKPKLTAQQIGHARKLIAQGEAPPAVAALLRVSRATLYPGAKHVLYVACRRSLMSFSASFLSSSAKPYTREKQEVIIMITLLNAVVSVISVIEFVMWIYDRCRK